MPAVNRENLESVGKKSSKEIAELINSQDTVGAVTKDVVSKEDKVVEEDKKSGSVEDIVQTSKGQEDKTVEDDAQEKVSFDRSSVDPALISVLEKTEAEMNKGLQAKFREAAELKKQAEAVVQKAELATTFEEAMESNGVGTIKYLIDTYKLPMKVVGSDAEETKKKEADNDMNLDELNIDSESRGVIEKLLKRIDTLEQSVKASSQELSGVAAHVYSNVQEKQLKHERDQYVNAFGMDADYIDTLIADLRKDKEFKGALKIGMTIPEAIRVVAHDKLLRAPKANQPKNTDEENNTNKDTAHMESRSVHTDSSSKEIDPNKLDLKELRSKIGIANVD